MTEEQGLKSERQTLQFYSGLTVLGNLIFYFESLIPMTVTGFTLHLFLCAFLICAF